MKIKIKCTKCDWEAEVEVKVSPIGSLKPGKKVKGSGKGIKIKFPKEQLDKMMEKVGSLGASRDDLSKMGIHIPLPEWNDARERKRIRDFVKKNLRVSKELRKAEGERSQVSTAPWQMGDSFRDIDLASSEVKAMGVEDLRLVPGVTLQKRVFETTKGKDRDVLKGYKFFTIVDVSGSMFDHSRGGKIDKVTKALLLAEETWKICKKCGFQFNLALFSDKANRVPRKRIKAFFKDENERATYSCWNGGTILSKALDLYRLDELKDGNLVIMSDMDIADIEIVEKKMKQIASVTNSFKVVLIEYKIKDLIKRIKQTQDLFPNKKVEILRIEI